MAALAADVRPDPAAQAGKGGLRLSSRAAMGGAGGSEPAWSVEMPGRPRKAGICVNGEEGGHGNEARKVLRALGVALEAPQPPENGDSNKSTETTTNLTLRAVPTGCLGNNADVRPFRYKDLRATMSNMG